MVDILVSNLYIISCYPIYFVIYTVHIYLVCFCSKIFWEHWYFYLEDSLIFYTFVSALKYNFYKLHSILCALGLTWYPWLWPIPYRTVNNLTLSLLSFSSSVPVVFFPLCRNILYVTHNVHTQFFTHPTTLFLGM